MVKLKVTTHSSDNEDIIEVEEYDVKEITKLRNGDDESIAIGDISYSRIDIKNIKPVDEKEPNQDIPGEDEKSENDIDNPEEST